MGSCILILKRVMQIARPLKALTKAVSVLGATDAVVGISHRLS